MDSENLFGSLAVGEGVSIASVYFKENVSIFNTTVQYLCNSHNIIDSFELSGDWDTLRETRNK